MRSELTGMPSAGSSPDLQWADGLIPRPIGLHAGKCSSGSGPVRAHRCSTRRSDVATDDRHVHGRRADVEGPKENRKSKRGSRRVKRNFLALLCLISLRCVAPMDEIRERPPGDDAAATAVGVGAKKECLSFAVSVQEGLRYVKALLLGQAKKMRARNEREATEADLRTAKMQVDAADAAEDAKKRIHDKAA
ncbi:hypothetical protein EUGRSUZ_F00437 [Eucalyptus grandis]|uniref:Uncharacterized protein n=2 Tax=Eucalyptus grandis TaxID=71139 RepID=A0ACC3KBF9_EUCGR|nr:hypothetical protein EUGRSUZ_F00437 [Eucalyptus grandis]